MVLMPTKSAADRFRAQCEKYMLPSKSICSVRNVLINKNSIELPNCVGDPHFGGSGAPEQPLL